MKYVPLFLVAGAAALLAACGGGTTAAPAKSADKIEQEQTAQLVAEAARQTGAPNITSFTEKKFAKLIYELRDKEITTYSYFMDMHGNLHFLCESIGYGLPFSVQYVNPERVAHEVKRIDTSSFGTMPQPEPNGLFMPEGLAATWVLCADPDAEGGVRPVYSEPELIVTPFPLQGALNNLHTAAE